MTNQIKIKKGEIVDYLENLKPKIDKVIERYLPKKANKKWLDFTFGKPRYSFDLRAAQGAISDPVWDFLSRGGKRWRPVLFLLVTEAIGGDIEKVKDFVVIPELIHNGTIIVDDLEDQSEMRRGKPCLHKIFGVDIAMNAGNFLYYLPLLALIKNRKRFKPQVLVRAYETYIQECINLHFGQGTDIYWHKGKVKEINEKQYLQMCAFKTGGLSRMAAKLAVVLSGESAAPKGRASLIKRDELAEKVGRVAEAIGVAFQIQDDILNLTGEKFAKGKGGLGEDITEGKRSLMVIHTLQKANQKDKKRLLKILALHTKSQKLRNEAIEIIQRYNSIEYAKEKAKSLVRDAWRKTDKLLKPSQAKERLNEFVTYLIEREI